VNPDRRIVGGIHHDPHGRTARPRSRVARDTTSVALLAPGTVRGDGAFGNLASFGGSSVAENQYYINGFNVTNSFRSLNFSKVPFEGIAEQQVKTGWLRCGIRPFARWRGQPDHQAR
jgi:hypothetical protein